MEKKVNWFAAQIKELVSIWSDFLLKGLLEQTLEGTVHQTKMLLMLKIWEELFRNKLLHICTLPTLQLPVKTQR